MRNLNGSVLDIIGKSCTSDELQLVAFDYVDRQVVDFVDGVKHVGAAFPGQSHNEMQPHGYTGLGCAPYGIGGVGP